MIEDAELRRFRVGLAVVLGLIAVTWGGYQLAQPGHDPRYDEPAFDSAYYVAWSDAILSGADPDGRFDGAFYRAPLYAYGISFLRGVLGVGTGAIRWLQLLAALVSTACLAHVAFRWAGASAGIATAALLGAYHPWLFFSARLLAETSAIALLAFALVWISRREPRWTALAGVAVGLAALARPNLLLVAVLWSGYACWIGQRRKAVLLVLVLAGVVLPVTSWNWQRSGHLVPISSNGGLTLYHGNGPGAAGVYTAVAGMSAAIEGQRTEATRTAERLTGRTMDAVDADRYWGRQAVRQRTGRPAATVVLAWNRLLLTVGSAEISLDEAPTLDPNPWSRVPFVPFAAILALAAAGLASGRRPRLAGWVWTALIACAATPLIFYVSSRYRLPMAILLAVPAGVGAARLLAADRRAAIVTLFVGLLSVGVPAVAPYSGMIREARADGEAELARSYLDRSRGAAGDDERRRWSEAARAALVRGGESDERSSKVWFFRGLLARHEGRLEEAEEAWLHAWHDGRAAPPRVAAAANLSEIWIRAGRVSAAVRLLRQALQLEPLDETCRHNLIAALIAIGEHAKARREIARARSFGVAVDPELVALSGSGE